MSDTPDPMAEMVGRAFDAFCERRAKDLVTPDEVLALFDAVLTEERIGRFVTRFVAPSRTRILGAARASDLLLAVWLPTAARDEIAELLGEPAPLPAKLVDEAIASERVRDEVRAMLHDTLTSFVSRAVGGGGDAKDASGSLRGALGRGALGFAAAGKNLFGGIGAELQRQLQDKVRDFVGGSVAALQTRSADRLKSPETGASLGKRRREAFVRALDEKESEIVGYAEKTPFDRIDRLVPSILAHNVARAPVRDVVRAEIEAALEELSKQTLGELLDELGIRAMLRASTIRHAGPIVAAALGGLRRSALGDHLVARVLEEEPLEAISRVARRRRERLVLGRRDAGVLGEHAKRRACQHRARVVDGQMNRVRRERRDLERHAGRRPRGVDPRKPAPERVVHVHRHVEQPAGAQDAGDLVQDLRGVRGVIEHVVREDEIERRVRKRQRLAGRRHGPRARLPRRKEPRVRVGERIHTDGVLEPEEEDEPVGPRPDVEHAGRRGQRPHRLDARPDLGGVRAQLGRHLRLVAREVARLLLLVRELPLQRARRPSRERAGLERAKRRGKHGGSLDDPAPWIRCSILDQVAPFRGDAAARRRGIAGNSRRHGGCKTREQRR